MLDQHEAAIRVVGCLQQMGEQQSNPVLAILKPGEKFLEHRQYPPGKLTFNDGNWRAYYHCHAPPYRFENEHGHFHLFHNVDDEQWAHVVALSIDRQGQAQKWFVTNRWVTDESWQDAEQVCGFFSDQPVMQELLLVEQWLYNMVVLYQDELKQLLQKRDQLLEKLASGSTKIEVLEDRDYYVMAETAINLEEKLTEALTH